jgi:hypothetical protein
MMGRTVARCPVAEGRDERAYQGWQAIWRLCTSACCQSSNSEMSQQHIKYCAPSTGQPITVMLHCANRADRPASSQPKDVVTIIHAAQLIMQMRTTTASDMNAASAHGRSGEWRWRLLESLCAPTRPALKTRKGLRFSYPVPLTFIHQRHLVITHRLKPEASRPEVAARSCWR